jgi:hypothetical protein
MVLKCRGKKTQDARWPPNDAGRVTGANGRKLRRFKELVPLAR